MPGYKMHLFGGAAVAAIILYQCPTQFCASLNNKQQVFFVVITLIGALFPDIDIKSKGQKLFSWILLPILFTTILLRKFNLLALLAMITLFPLIISHRGITHNPWFLISIPLVTFAGSQLYMQYLQTELMHGALFFTAGAFSHILLDFGPIKLFTRDKRGF